MPLLKKKWCPIKKEKSPKFIKKEKSFPIKKKKN